MQEETGMRIGRNMTQERQAGRSQAGRNAQHRTDGLLAGRMRGRGITEETYGGFSLDGVAQGGTRDWILAMAGKEEEERRDVGSGGNAPGSGGMTGNGNVPAQRPEAAAIYEAAVAGRDNPIENMRKPSKVPYGHMAKDGVIEYNGVCFVCDEKTNSICLGDVTDPKKVLNIPLSGGGHLKVNRDSLGLLSKAIGMFSPEDVNRILRAIAQDTKIQSMKNEIEDIENSVGENLQQGETDDGEDTGRNTDAVEDAGTSPAAALDADIREKAEEA